MQPKTKLDLNKISLAYPCPVRWEDMRGGERVRNCDSCSLQVFNTAELTEREVVDLISSRSDSRLCIRLHKRSDGTLITKNCPIGFRASVRRAAKFAGASISVLLGLFSIGISQNKTFEPSAKTTISNRTNTNKIVIEGVVTDSNQAVIPAASIKVFSANGKKLIYRSKTDDQGGFKITFPMPGAFVLKFSSAGFDEKILEISLGSNEAKEMNVVLEVENETVVVGIFLSEPLINMTSNERSTTLKPNPFDQN